MGYTRRFDLINVLTAKQKDAILAMMHASSDSDAFLWPLAHVDGSDTWVFYGHTDGDYEKWYDFDTDMRELSTRMPEVLFIMRVDGEEEGDLWKHYYQNGKSCKCKGQKIEVFDEFVPENMTTAATT